MDERELLEHACTRSIIGAFYEVYNELGFGFLESLYAAALERELLARGHRVARELRARVMYKGSELGFQRLDFVVDGAVVVEVKSALALPPTARRQLHSYLRATNLGVGLVLHFGPAPRVYRCRSGRVGSSSADA